MTHFRPPLTLGLAILLCSSALLADETAGYSMPLFNGKDLAGWIVTGCEAVVEDGSLVLKSGNGLVRSEHRYGDFVLELKWRPRKKDAWDSGIYFRCDEPQKGQPWPARYQANLSKGREGDVGGLSGATGGAKLVRPGEWNHFVLTAVGSKAELKINGQLAWKTDGIAAPHGYIGLQAEVPSGGQFEFRDIRITELGHSSLFNGKDLAGWEGAGAEPKCWGVRDGGLVCTGEKGPWLRSKQQYGDFNLRLQYKLAAGGNSGVYLRVPHGGAHRGKDADEKEAGVEVQLLDDKAAPYAKLQPYQYCGSVYAIAPASQRVGREVGQWNSLEINCDGTHYRVTHNGQLIVDANEKEFPELRNRLLKGYLGLQNHSTPVWFRHVRIGGAVK
jgi:hypothetical protein